MIELDQRFLVLRHDKRQLSTTTETFVTRLGPLPHSPSPPRSATEQHDTSEQVSNRGTHCVVRQTTHRPGYEQSTLGPSVCILVVLASCW